MSTRRPGRLDPGFTLIEVLIALALVVTMVLGLAGLVAVGVRSAHTSRDRTTATMLAVQRMEELRALTLGYAGAEQAVPWTDTTTDLSLTPASAAGAGLSASPGGTLDSNTLGYVDYLDRHGRWVGTGPAPPAAAVYVRRWRVAPAALQPDSLLLLHVLVTTVRRESTVDHSIRPRPRHADDALLVTMRMRKAS